MHMLSSLDDLGRAGLTAIGDDQAEAQALYERAHAVLFDAAADAAVQVVVAPIATTPEPGLALAA
jgi:hypothetical protein